MNVWEPVSHDRTTSSFLLSLLKWIPGHMPGEAWKFCRPFAFKHIRWRTKRTSHGHRTQVENTLQPRRATLQCCKCSGHHYRKWRAVKILRHRKIVLVWRKTNLPKQVVANITTRTKTNYFQDLSTSNSTSTPIFLKNAPKTHLQT